MSLENRIFREDPLIFLESQVIIIPEATDHAVAKASGDVHMFDLVPARRNAVFLKPATGPGGVEAYYLPWSSGESTVMTLGAKADFFFTSQLTNCRFAILDAGVDSAAPKVAHTAGDKGSSPTKRDEWEKAKGFAKDGTLTRYRALDKAEGLTQTRVPTGKLNKIGKAEMETVIGPGKHEYRGQDVGGELKSSAFVFGRRVGHRWHFHAQITKGVRTEKADIDVTDNLTILKWADKRRLYEF